MRRLAFGGDILSRILIPVALALGLLAAPVECHLAAGPHSLFQNPAAVAALAGHGHDARPAPPADATAAMGRRMDASASTATGAEAPDTGGPRLSPMTPTPTFPAPALAAPASLALPVAGGPPAVPAPAPLVGQAAPGPEPPPPQIALAFLG